MKKKYIRPQSMLYAINLSENIASSEVGSEGDIVGGNMIIKFSSVSNGCRGYYTGDQTSPVTVTGSFSEYYTELSSLGKINLFMNCLKLNL